MLCAIEQRKKGEWLKGGIGMNVGRPLTGYKMERTWQILNVLYIESIWYCVELDIRKLGKEGVRNDSGFRLEKLGRWGSIYLEKVWV